MSPDAPPQRPGLSGVTPEALAAWLAERAVPAYRARQVADAVWKGSVATIDEIRTLPAGLRADLEAAFRFDTVADTEWKEADGGLTEKALHRLADGALIESVLMHYPARRRLAGAAHAVHLEPGRLRRGLPVLRDRGARVRAGPRGGRDRRPGPARLTPPRRRTASG